MSPLMRKPVLLAMGGLLALGLIVVGLILVKKGSHGRRIKEANVAIQTELLQIHSALETPKFLDKNWSPAGLVLCHS